MAGGLVAAGSGCAASQSDLRAPGAAAEEAALEQALRELPGAPDPAEARLLARAALAASGDLSARYRPLSPPHLGNLAFHLGLRERALCCHWVEDLLRALDVLELHSFELHWVVAHHGSRLREHSAVLALPLAAEPAQGLILDAWRHSGRLHWTRVDADRYPWQLHPSDANRHDLHCD